MLSKVVTAVTKGTEGRKVLIETDISKGMPGLTIVGLADTTVKEAKERIHSAIININKAYPVRKITVNLSPANIRKKGSHFDLPMAIGILLSSGQLKEEEVKEYAFIGELSLDGSLNRCKGILPMVMALRKEGITKVIVPEANGEEAGLVRGVKVYGAGNLKDVTEFLKEKKVIEVCDNTKAVSRSYEGIPDFAEVKGHAMAKRAITLAVAGNHGLLMMGSPSSGKTMLASRIPGIMPALTFDEIVELTEIYSVAGLLDETVPYISRRPFVKPHSGITPAGMLGGGAIPLPGEISLAHKGVLFLDEAGEFNRRVIEGLRVPMERKSITLVRRGESFSYPCDFLLIAATNPCKCGYYGDPSGKCRCSEREVINYQSRLSGPVLDRIDMHISLQPVDYSTLTETEGESSAAMRMKIEKAREFQAARQQELNGNLSESAMDKFCRTSKEGNELLQEAYVNLGLNPRTLGKIKKIARTIADMEQSESIMPYHIAEAMQFREVFNNER